MIFETIEEMAAFYDENKEDYILSFGSDGAHLRNRSDYAEVAFVPDDRAAAVALGLLADTMDGVTEKRITSLTFELVPWVEHGKQHLKTVVVVNGLRFDYNEFLVVDDTIAVIDTFFDIAKDKIKGHIAHDLGEMSPVDPVTDGVLS